MVPQGREDVTARGRIGAYLGQQVILTVFGKSGGLNVDTVHADKPTGKEIWSLLYHCRL